MAAPKESRPALCHLCGKPACQGECKSCPKKKTGACPEFYTTITERVPGLGTVHRWAHGRCYLKRGDSK